MNYGLISNWITLVVPILFLVGIGVGYNLVLPGKGGKIRRPFHWKSSTPGACVILFYSVATGIVFAFSLAFEYGGEIAELFGKMNATLSAFLTAFVIVICSIMVMFVMMQCMKFMYNAHKRELKRRLAKIRGCEVVRTGRTERTFCKENAEGPESDNADGNSKIDATRRVADDDKVIRLTPRDFRAKRHKKGFWQTWNKHTRSLSECFSKVVGRYDPMTLPDRAVERFRRQG